MGDAGELILQVAVALVIAASAAYSYSVYSRNGKDSQATRAAFRTHAALLLAVLLLYIAEYRLWPDRDPYMLAQPRFLATITVIEVALGVAVFLTSRRQVRT